MEQITIDFKNAFDCSKKEKWMIRSILDHKCMRAICWRF